MCAERWLSSAPVKRALAEGCALAEHALAEGHAVTERALAEQLTG